MKNIEKLIEPLNLIYYEYEKSSNSFILDRNYSNEHIFEELIKITYLLSKNNINFFVDEKKSLVLNAKDSIFLKIKRYIASFFENIKNSSLNIYVLNDKNVKWAKNLPVIKIETTKVDFDFSKYDAIIFTSKNAIYSLNSYNQEWIKKPIYAIAPQTAKVASNLGAKIKFVSKEKHGDEFAKELVPLLKNKKVLYIRGSKVVTNLVETLNSNGAICDETIVYETVCVEFKKKIKLPKNSVIIFSSPSTIECFLKNSQWDDSYRAVSIGHTTEKYFPPYITPYVSETTSLDSCVKKAIELSR
ncbi:uroporphyrinogen-III synthase [Sulfurimonas crateris]|uniref:Uroporphyrinogen-III synthase n=1 Tax=Sulfurimonas crateris TaxID=2574727 RepID=A0A4U2Z5P9_9BACT|nr:uroporphyrinogen-III synthase [Sulfurimonas crateris]TKI69508.1 uroporphyrinogen-III synthase [Sulfurimonas crateris]